jgi:CRP-like cAMP-binding protein
MNSFSPDYFIHAANVLLLVAYSVRDILWLRVFAVASALVSIPFYFLQPAVLWAPLVWTIGFAGINSFQSLRLMLERRPVKLTAEEEEVRRLAFRDVLPRQLLRVLSIGAWTTEPPGARLIENGKVPDDLALIVRGNVRVSSAGSDIGLLGPGEFVGSALILGGVPPEFDAAVEEPVRAVRWNISALGKYLDANPDMRMVMQRHLARELSGKLGRVIAQRR